jgi:hypothetical protein
MVVGVARIRHALGDGATEAQARDVYALLRREGLIGASEGIPELVGVAEFAEMAGVTPGAVCQWVDLPEPITTLKNGRIWRKTTVERYLVGKVIRKRRSKDHSDD